MDPEVVDRDVQHADIPLVIWVNGPRYIDHDQSFARRMLPLISYDAYNNEQHVNEYNNNV